MNIREVFLSRNNIMLIKKEVGDNYDVENMMYTYMIEITPSYGVSIKDVVARINSSFIQYYYSVHPDILFTNQNLLEPEKPRKVGGGDVRYLSPQDLTTGDFWRPANGKFPFQANRNNPRGIHNPHMQNIHKWAYERDPDFAYKSKVMSSRGIFDMSTFDNYQDIDKQSFLDNLP